MAEGYQRYGNEWFNKDLYKRLYNFVVNVMRTYITFQFDGTVPRKGMGKSRNIKKEYIDPLHYVHHVMHKIPKERKGGNIKYNPDVPGCGVCGKKTHSLHVHDKDPSDYTCSDCYGGGLTSKQYSTRQAKIKPITESKHPDHQKTSLDYMNNHYLSALSKEPQQRLWEQFDASADLDKKFLRRMEQDNIYGGTRHPKNTDRLTYLLGKYEHDGENMNQVLKSNLNSLITDHLYKNKEKYNNPVQNLRLDAFHTYPQLKEYIEKEPQILRHILVE